ncbi:lipoprotein [Steroidobacter agaridevorans]|uniref:Lipoprotein n=2 Tax=Steroidobacter agaridevorans TaxID=2695856 RepID=A0A829YD78_9GAMM|nr:lipoprotein [Steroidobacter agaridevorans]
MRTRDSIMSFKPYFSRVAAAFALTAALFAAGCATTSGPKTRIDYDRSADFSVYRTYGFPKETGTDRGGYSTLVTSYLKSAMSAQMEARGYKYSEEHPDLLVNFYMNTRERTEIRPDARASVGYGYYGYRYGLYNAWPMYDEDRTVTYKVGTLNLDIVDAEKKQLVWEGVAEGRVNEDELQNPKVAINAVVTELMRQYPGKPNM